MRTEQEIRNRLSELSIESWEEPVQMRTFEVIWARGFKAALEWVLKKR